MIKYRLMKILTTPDPFLRKVAKPVLKLDKKLEKQIADIISTLKGATNPEGVGLAATQVGIDKRLFVVALNGKPEIFINPKVIELSPAMLSDIYKKAKRRWLEGCLSLPRIWGFVDRPYWVELEYQTPENGKLITKRRRFEDMESSYVQHENDHLDGILFTDHILRQGGVILKETPQGLLPIEDI
jgi:peptide deformylase